MGGVPNAPGPSPTLGSLGPSHQWRHKSWVSLRGPPCAHGVAGTPQGDVHDMPSLEKVLGMFTLASFLVEEEGLAPCIMRSSINLCRAPFLEECPQHHGHKGDPGVTPGTCGAIGERTQVILVWVRAPRRWERLLPMETRSHEGKALSIGWLMAL